MQTYKFRIAELNILISFAGNGKKGIQLLPSFKSFMVDEHHEELFFQLTVDDSLEKVPETQCKRIRTFDTGNGDTIVDRLDNGGYQYIVKDIRGEVCCLLVTNKDFSNSTCALYGGYNMRCFGLNNALMLIFAFAGARKNTLLIHASLVRNNGYGYAFIAKSGTGKSTQVSMWLRYISGSDLMNDDTPIIRLIDNEFWIFGGPWSGKTPCYRNVKAKLGAITRINRFESNSVEKLLPSQAFASVLPSCARMKWDSEIYNALCDTITKIVEKTNIYILHCLPNKEAAEVCYNAIAKNKNAAE